MWPERTKPRTEGFIRQWLHVLSFLGSMPGGDAGKRAEQKHTRGKGREELPLSTDAVLVTPGLISVSTQKHFAHLGHQAYFALLLFLFPVSLPIQYLFLISSHSPAS